jgi:hypothetical protein
LSARKPRSLLAVAIERENWELAALCLIAGFLEVLQELPPDAAESLLEIMATEDEPRRHRSRERRRGRRR